MRVVVAPPHRDLSLTPLPVDGFELFDAAQAFVDRALAPSGLVERANQLELTGESGSAHACLMLRAAADVLGRPSASAMTRLRANGAALGALGAPTCPVQLRLDDLELARGTTERGADALAAARAGPTPFTPELESATAACRNASVARLWIEGDQQLPAALSIALALEGATKLELAGTFAYSHRSALCALEPFSRATFIDAPPRFRLCFEPLPPFEWSLDRDRVIDCSPWAGYVPLEALCAPQALLESGCQTAVVAFCQVGEQVLDDRGQRIEAARVREGAARLRSAGVAVVGEWWLGAPGVDEAAVEATWRQLEEAPFFDRLGGLRVFHWARHLKAVSFGGRGVELLPIAADRNLARSRPFRCEGTLSAAGLLASIERLGSTLRERGALAPGRVAAAYLSPTARSSRGGRGLRLDADCALIQTRLRLDGGAEPTWYAVQLRAGKVLALDAKVASTLGVLREAQSPAEAWPSWSEPMRAKVARMLIDKQVLEEVAG